MTPRGWVGVLAAGWIAGLTAIAHGEPARDEAVALLPLDAERSLEIYGQPVASEIARALGAGNVAVVVVGPRMAVPERARLIIDGTIVGRASAVTISLRIRNTLDGVVLETLSATAPGLAKIDGAAADLSARVLPIVRQRLAGLQRGADDHGRVVQVRPPARAAAPPQESSTPAPDKIVLVALTDSTRTPGGGVLLGALDAAVSAWSRAHHREPRKLDASKLDPRLAASSVAAGGSDLAFGFWILGYAPELGPVPMARARVRVQITSASAVLFNRVVATDTVLGEKGLSPPELAGRVAREVLAIVRPHVRRSVASWP